MSGFKLYYFWVISLAGGVYLVSVCVFNKGPNILLYVIIILHGFFSSGESSDNEEGYLCVAI